MVVSHTEGAGLLLSLLSQVREPELEGVKSPAQGHTAGCRVAEVGLEFKSLCLEGPTSKTPTLLRTPFPVSEAKNPLAHLFGPLRDAAVRSFARGSQRSRHQPWAADKTGQEPGLGLPPGPLSLWPGLVWSPGCHPQLCSGLARQGVLSAGPDPTSPAPVERREPPPDSQATEVWD